MGSSRIPSGRTDRQFQKSSIVRGEKSYQRSFPAKTTKTQISGDISSAKQSCVTTRRLPRATVPSMKVNGAAVQFIHRDSERSDSNSERTYVVMAGGVQGWSTTESSRTSSVA